MPRILLFLILFKCLPAVAQVSLFDRTRDYIQKVTSEIDSASPRIKREKVSIHQKSLKVKTFVKSETVHAGSRIKIRYRKNYVVSKEKYYITNLCYMRILRVNGKIQLIKFTTKDKTSGLSQKNIFANLGDDNWQWTYYKFINGQKKYVTEKVKHKSSQ